MPKAAQKPWNSSTKIEPQLLIQKGCVKIEQWWLIQKGCAKGGV
jgi:hypothetical protein